MRLNELKPGAGSREERNRVGRGMSSGNGKTAGRGHKGQKSRTGGFHKVGFEGGQMPLQRRVPKRGFRSRRVGRMSEVRLSELNSVVGDSIDFATLRSARIVPADAQSAKIIASGSISRAVAVKGVVATPGARAAIEKAGGTVEG